MPDVSSLARLASISRRGRWAHRTSRRWTEVTGTSSPVRLTSWRKKWWRT